MSTYSFILAGLGNPRNKKEEKTSCRFLQKRHGNEPLLSKWFSSKFKMQMLYEKYLDHNNSKDELDLLQEQIEKTWPNSKISTFHYLFPETHEVFFAHLMADPSNPIYVIPLFPQFSYFYAGALAKYFSEKLDSSILKKLFWIKSFSLMPDFIHGLIRNIKQTLKEKSWTEQQTLFIFTASSPSAQTKENEQLYFFECETAYKQIIKSFPFALGIVGYQPSFYLPYEIEPSTKTICSDIKQYAMKRNKVLFIPLSLIYNDWHTLYEIESSYIPSLVNQGFEAAVIEPMQFDQFSLEAFSRFIDPNMLTTTSMLTSST